MSDVMMFGIAKMPYELAMSDELSRCQFYANTQRLAAALEAARAERDELREALKDMRQVLEVLSRAHQTAMVQTLKARIPECAEFGGIAQDLDFVVATLRERLGEGAVP